MAYRSKLFQFWKEQEAKRGREIKIKEVQDATGLQYRSIRNLLDDDTRRFDDIVISGLCKFFGLPAGPVPWLVYEPEEEAPEDQKSPGPPT